VIVQVLMSKETFVARYLNDTMAKKEATKHADEYFAQASELDAIAKRFAMDKEYYAYRREKKKHYKKPRSRRRRG